MLYKLLRFACLLPLAGCVDTDEPVEPVETDLAPQLVPIGSGETTGGGPEVCKTVSLSGRIMYNDLRESGRFGDRSTLVITVPGTEDSFGDSGDRENYLGMKGVKIELHEVDLLGLSHQGCARNALEGSTYADDDGSWSWTGEVCDVCRIDGEGANDNGVSVAARVVLAHCDDPSEGCFSVDEPIPNGSDHFDGNWSGTTWYRWWRGADLTSPRRLFNATPVSVGVDYFQTNLPSVRMETTDLYAKASNIFASLIDVTERVHGVEGVPFDRARWGTIRAYFPNGTGTGAHSHQADRFCVGEFAGHWIPGSETTHEYGHLVHYWEWDGVGKYHSFCMDSDGDGELDTIDEDGHDTDGDGDGRKECDEGGDETGVQREYAGAAFKEGWASFVTRVTFEGANTGHSCGSIHDRAPTAYSFRRFDNSLVCPAGAATCVEGRHFIGDVERALCEIYDGDSDDTLDLTFADMVDTLRLVWTTADPADREEVREASTFGIHDTAIVPLGICRFAETLDGAMGLPRADVESALAAIQLECNL